jgi:hypothetical protein
VSLGVRQARKDTFKMIEEFNGGRTRPIEKMWPPGISLRVSGRGRGLESAEGTVNEPIYRWECSFCGAAGAAESSEMARLTIDAHLAVAHPDRARERRVTDAGSERAT